MCPLSGNIIELAKELEVGAHHIARGAVIAIIDYLDVIHVVGVQPALCLVIQFGGELEWPASQLELVFHGRQNLERAL